MFIWASSYARRIRKVTAVSSIPPTVEDSSSVRAEVAAPSRLSGHMGTWALVLSVLAFSSPLTSAAGYLAFVISSAGQTAPMAFLVCTVLLAVFTVGYMAMTQRMPRPGAFYAYISSGLGRQVGLGSAFVALVSYTLILIGVYFFAGTVVTGLVAKFSGPDIEWWVGALAIWALVSVLGYFNVDISAKVLVWVMVLEVALVAAFDIGVLVRGGEEGFAATPINLSEYAQSGAVAVSLLFAVLVFIGFEATALYRDEVKDPDSTLPRATYIAVLFIGLFYALTTWAMVVAFGRAAQDEATRDAAGMFSAAAERYMGDTFQQVVTVLLVTAIIAALLSIHNASTRYLFNLSADGAVPRLLSVVHERFRSPYASSVGISAVVAVVLAYFAVRGSDPGLLYGQFAGLGSTGIIFLMAVVSLAVIVWFLAQGRGGRDANWLWKTAVAPGISLISLVAIIVYVLFNFEYVVGGEPGQNLPMLVVPAVAFISGLAVASFLKAKQPETYARLGGTDR